MTDRELLELAAKAAGLTIKSWPQENYAVVKDGDTAYGWSPLIYDSDALRLAVKLGIDVMHTNIHAPQVHAMADCEVACSEGRNEDPYAATRRAITRAAAEVGRNMQ
jgi:hypothetical protein